MKLSRATCGRYLSINRTLYHLQVPRTARPKAEMPFRAERRHQFWSVDIRYLDMHRLDGGMIYCISILENFSRAILASAISRKQDTEAFFAVLYDAVRHFGVPEVLVSDNGSIFTSHETRWTCEQLGIEKKEIKKRRPYQNYIEAAFGVQRRMADWRFEKAQSWEDLFAAHDKWMWITTSSRCAMSAHVESLSQKGEDGALPLGHGTYRRGNPKRDHSMSRTHWRGRRRLRLS